MSMGNTNAWRRTSMDIFTKILCCEKQVSILHEYFDHLRAIFPHLAIQSKMRFSFVFFCKMVLTVTWYSYQQVRQVRSNNKYKPGEGKLNQTILYSCLYYARMTLYKNQIWVIMNLEGLFTSSESECESDKDQRIKDKHQKEIFALSRCEWVLMVILKSQITDFDCGYG